MSNNEEFNNKLNDILEEVYSADQDSSITIHRDDDTIFQITNSKTQLELLKNKSNNIQNISIIDLGNCETILREVYNINENNSLIFIKNEKKTNKASEKDINFEVYEPYNKTKLNLSVCDEKSINIIIPATLSEETKKLYEKMKESGYDMFDKNSAFYQDICTPFDSEDGTDILLSDRMNYIFNNEDTRCQSNCELSFYSLESEYINCSCSTNQNTNNEKFEKFSAKKIYESFYDVLKYSNYDIIKCINIIDIKTIFSKNIGSIIVLIYFLGYLTCLIIFIFKGVDLFKVNLSNIIKMEKENNNFKINKYLEKL
jgi:hypothetical protein